MRRYHCAACSTTTYDETCRDCGEMADALCLTCGEIVDNCECEETA